MSGCGSISHRLRQWATAVSDMAKQWAARTDQPPTDEFRQHSREMFGISACLSDQGHPEWAEALRKHLCNPFDSAARLEVKTGTPDIVPDSDIAASLDVEARVELMRLLPAMANRFADGVDLLNRDPQRLPSENPWRDTDPHSWPRKPSTHTQQIKIDIKELRRRNPSLLTGTGMSPQVFVKMYLEDGPPGGWTVNNMAQALAGAGKRPAGSTRQAISAAFASLEVVRLVERVADAWQLGPATFGAGPQSGTP
jgi:hypothetical protein